jgi:hypothetical protein
LTSDEQISTQKHKKYEKGNTTLQSQQSQQRIWMIVKWLKSQILTSKEWWQKWSTKHV